MKQRSNISRADWLLVAATIVAGLRMMLIHAVFIGFDLEAWPWFKAAEVWSGLAFAVLEGVALAYVSRLWVGLRPARAIDWVYWLILAFGMAVMLGSVIGVTSYAASSVREKIGIDALLGSGEAVAWSMFVTALNPLMVILIGIARAIDPREQVHATDRAPWPPINVQVDLFVQQLGDATITPDEAAKRFTALTNQPIAARTMASALAQRAETPTARTQANLMQLSARASGDAAGEPGQGGEVVQQSPTEIKRVTMRNQHNGATADATLDQATRRAQVQQMAARGMSQGEMARALGVDRSTVARDLKALQKQNEVVHQNGKVREKVV